MDRRFRVITTQVVVAEKAIQQATTHLLAFESGGGPMSRYHGVMAGWCMKNVPRQEAELRELAPEAYVRAARAWLKLPSRFGGNEVLLSNVVLPALERPDYMPFGPALQAMLLVIRGEAEARYRKEPAFERFQKAEDMLPTKHILDNDERALWAQVQEDLGFGYLTLGHFDRAHQLIVDACAKADPLVQRRISYKYDLTGFTLR